jgi:hypothetical protein
MVINSCFIAIVKINLRNWKMTTLVANHVLKHDTPTQIKATAKTASIRNPRKKLVKVLKSGKIWFLGNMIKKGFSRC